MPIDREKYVTFKREDLFELMGELAMPPVSWAGPEQGEADCAPIAENIRRRIQEVELPDCFIIRTGDVFAGPALNAYAGVIGVAMSFIPPGHPTKKHLSDLADYINEMADKAFETNGKVPD